MRGMPSFMQTYHSSHVLGPTCQWLSDHASGSGISRALSRSKKVSKHKTRSAHDALCKQHIQTHPLGGWGVCQLSTVEVLAGCHIRPHLEDR